MKKNVGGYDRVVRAVLGPVLLVVGLAAFGGYLALAAGTLGTALAAAALLVGAVLAVTAVTQNCPLNSLLGLDTYRGGSATEPATDVEPGTRPN